MSGPYMTLVVDTVSPTRDVYFTDLDGKEHCLCVPRDLKERFLVVQGEFCPVCHNKQVLVSHDIKETAIFSWADYDRARKHLEQSGAKTMEDVLEPDCLQVRGENAWDDEYNDYAEAKCERCRSKVGEIRVPTGSLFGRTEDNLVIYGRPRVY